MMQLQIMALPDPLRTIHLLPLLLLDSGVLMTRGQLSTDPTQLGPKLVLYPQCALTWAAP